MLADLPGETGQAMALLDEAGAIVAVNAAWRGVMLAQGFGGRAGDVGQSYADVCRRLSPALDSAAFRDSLADVLAGRATSLTHPYAGESRRQREIRITPITLGPAALFVVTDDEVRRPAGAGPSAPEDLLAAQEEERLRISMELHDSTSQHLVALALGLARLRRLVGGAGALDVMEDMSTAIGEVVKEIRVLSYLTRPAALAPGDLEGAIRAFVRGFATRTGLTAELRARGRFECASPAVQHAVYRIVQEALANVYRHAGATRVEVELESDDELVSLRVADDGQGVPALRAGDPQAFQPGVGVAGMHTRAAQLGGRLDIGCPVRGLEIRVRLPIAAGEP
ncbi:sensor histidine kinase [Phenylobacterium sp. J367]|uniref:sensor histidine kinase n=1 Tax=Phenylobacterium sp. J367 TaxID=2898435 RepID=UPI002151A905|nr:ATP-binding protein [Phenylobacterium sp. J367]MCR5878822.1 histidine kinase [Phenylobacterium sp. J367]